MDYTAEILDVFKVLGVNCGTFAVVSLSDIELVLKCLLLAVTIAWTMFKAMGAWRALNDKEK